MIKLQILTNADVTHILQCVIDAGAEGVMSHLTKGKWRICEVVFKTLTPYTIHVEALRKEKVSPVDLTINQPVGMSVWHKSRKYIFEAVVVGYESCVTESCGGKIVLDLPGKIECMQQRAYSRAAVPPDLNVKALFWHRGYMDNTKEAPPENYWQGRVVDLSAGGLQIAVDVEQGPNFRVGQLVGLQFTPMSHQKPILLEAQVKHLAEKAEENQLYVGVEFMGLEMSGEGREKLRRIINIVSEYEKQGTTPIQVDES